VAARRFPASTAQQETGGAAAEDDYVEVGQLNRSPFEEGITGWTPDLEHARIPLIRSWRKPGTDTLCRLEAALPLAWPLESGRYGDGAARLRRWAPTQVGGGCVYFSVREVYFKARCEERRKDRTMFIARNGRCPSKKAASPAEPSFPPFFLLTIFPAPVACRFWGPNLRAGACRYPCPLQDLQPPAAEATVGVPPGLWSSIREAISAGSHQDFTTGRFKSGDSFVGPFRWCWRWCWNRLFCRGGTFFWVGRLGRGRRWRTVGPLRKSLLSLVFAVGAGVEPFDDGDGGANGSERKESAGGAAGWRGGGRRFFFGNFGPYRQSWGIPSFLYASDLLRLMGAFGRRFVATGQRVWRGLRWAEAAWCCFCFLNNAIFSRGGAMQRLQCGCLWVFEHYQFDPGSMLHFWDWGRFRSWA